MSKDLGEIDPSIKFQVENLRGEIHEHKPEVFIYNVENFLLVGTDNEQIPLSIDRSINLPRYEYILS